MLMPPDVGNFKLVNFGSHSKCVLISSLAPACGQRRPRFALRFALRFLPAYLGYANGNENELFGFGMKLFRPNFERSNVLQLVESGK